MLHSFIYGFSFLGPLFYFSLLFHNTVNSNPETFNSENLEEASIIVFDPVSDSLSLISLYNSSNGPNWTNTWDLNQPMSTWFGVTLNEDGCVECLDLDGTDDCILSLGSSGNNLVGNIPPQIGNMTALEVLILSKNELTSNIPFELGNLINTTILDFSTNNLVGDIPAEIGNLSSLEKLNLKENELSGAIPTTLDSLSNLISLNLRSNNLTGPIPSSLGNLSVINYLDLSFNFLSDSIPAGLGNLSNVSDFHLNNNSLIGNIPPELGNLTNVENINLSSNNLNGSIPSELGNLANVKEFYLQNNLLTDDIPHELGNLSNVENFNLSSNNLNGRIPSELGNLSNVKEVYLQNNLLTDDIPNELGNLSNVEIFNLSSNSLDGRVPLELGSLSNVTRFYLQENQLTGCFPDEIDFICELGFSIDINSDGYNLTNNPGLPWGGDFERWCNGNLVRQPIRPGASLGDFERWCNGNDQIGSSCDDGDPVTSNDVITSSCECEGLLPTSINEIVEELNIEIFPNPTVDFFSIKNFSEKQIQAIEIIDVRGEVLKSIIGDIERVIDISDFSEGVYLIKIKVEGSNQVLYQNLMIVR